MLRVDLNCDMGEGCGSDAELMKYITSANIACGYHAGDDATMRRTAELAVEHGVRIGAHPGYPDRKNFGRTQIKMPAKKIREIVGEQVGSMRVVAMAAGGRLVHVKPHGALYNQAANDAEISTAIAEGIRDVDADLILFGLSASASIEAAKKVGLRTASEVFADRTYQTDGTLTSRTKGNALIDDAGLAATQALDMVKYGRVRSVDAVMVKIVAETICIHGDGPHALTFAQVIRSALEANGIEIAPVH
jgi:UPF0271 protein